ncbi:hypothetical protein K435DRAFT_871245 [Dendrothele bispora CBS 962.96]|uniref:Uncharacterized protein n=1 Tax=Dendrothele bispora (strain CBS 962.96) TaxID=1314807 RepID=A0A4S8L4I9_DENBC|nr:hypothetical protein K435DRAFT_871245 [Dendrothele bispora CBS 962.96]
MTDAVCQLEKAEVPPLSAITLFRYSTTTKEKMHLEPSHRASGTVKQQEDVPILIFKRGEKRKFLRRPDTYEDMIRVVRRKFSIGEGETPVFETRSLGVCNDQNIEIDEEVYPLMASYLDEIEVSVLERTNFDTDQKVMDDVGHVEPLVGTSGSRQEDAVGPERNFLDGNEEPDILMEEADMVATVGASDSKGTKEMDTIKGKEKATDEFVDTALGKHQDVIEGKKGTNDSNLDDILAKPTSKNESEKSRNDEPHNEKENTKGKEQKYLPTVVEEDEVTTPTEHNKPASESETKAKETNVPLDNDTAPAVVDVTSGSTTVRQSTASLQPSRLDDEFDNTTAKDETANVPPLQTTQNDDQRHRNHARDDDPAGLFDDEITDIGRMQKSEDEVQRALVKVEVDGLPTSPKFDDSDRKREHVKVKKEASGRLNDTSPGRSGRERVGTSGVAPSDPVKASPSRSNKTKTGPTPSGPSRSQTSADTDQVRGMVAAADDTTEEERFKVFIEGPGGKADMAEFMTRLRHPVKKVLQRACKHFGVDPKRAQLELLIDSIEEDDTVVTHSFKCQKGETMGQAGVNPLANLRVAVQEEDE